MTPSNQALYNPLLSAGKIQDLFPAGRIWKRWWDVTPLFMLHYIRLQFSKPEQDSLLNLKKQIAVL